MTFRAVGFRPELCLNQTSRTKNAKKATAKSSPICKIKQKLSNEMAYNLNIGHAGLHWHYI